MDPFALPEHMATQDLSSDRSAQLDWCPQGFDLPPTHGDRTSDPFCASARRPAPRSGTVMSTVGSTGPDLVPPSSCGFEVLGQIEGGEIDTTFFDTTSDPVKKIGVFPAKR